MCGEQLFGGGSRVNGIGITPACAGNSAHKQFTLFERWDHPRVCGEQASVSALIRHMGGSPPRVRGTAQGRRR